MATFNNGESLASVRTKINDAIDKIDGNATISNDLSFGDNDKAIFGAGSDLQIYHDSATNDSIIKESGTGHLRILGDDVKIRDVNNAEMYIDAVKNGAVSIYYDNDAKLRTTSTGISVTGNATFADNGKAIFGAGSDLEIYHDASNSQIINSVGHLNIDNNGDDKQINLRSDDGSGGITNYIRVNGNTGAVQLYHYGSTKLATTSTGVDITGTLTSDGLTVDGATTITGNTSPASDEVLLNLASLNGVGAAGNMLRFTDTDPTAINNGSIGKIQFYSEDTDAVVVEIEGQNADASPDGRLLFKTAEGTTLRSRMQIANSGDISFYEYTGTTAKFFWDAAAESLGIGTTSPNTVIDARQTSTGGSTQIRVYNTDNSNTTTQTAGLFLSPDSRGNGALIFAEKENADFSTSAGRDVSLVFSPVLNNSQTEAMRIDSSGNVGIGTSSPQTSLHITESAATAILRLHRTGATNAADAELGQIEFFNADGSSDGPNVVAKIVGSTHAASGAGGNLRFFTHDGTEGGEGSDPVERLRVDGSGNVGIGETDPSYLLDLKGGTGSSIRLNALNGSFIFANGSGTDKGSLSMNGGNLDVAADAGIDFYSGGSPLSGDPQVTIDSSGNVGIGTSSPERPLHILSTLPDQIILEADSTTIGPNIIFKNTDGNLARIASAETNTLRFEVGPSNTEVMRIDSSGNVGIGTTSPSAPLTVKAPSNAEAIHVIGRSDDIGQIVFIEADGTTKNARIDARNTHLNIGTLTSLPLKFETNATERMRIDSSGNLLIGGTVTPTSSAKNLVLHNGTAPTGSATDGVILYAEDVSSSSELKVRDEAGNVTTLSPHNFDLIPEGPSEDMAWSYYSERDGKRINVDMLKAIRLLEQISGEKLVHMV